jgi:putative membrane protein
MCEMPLSGVLFRVSRPNLALIAASGGCLTYYNEVVAPATQLWCPIEPFSMPTLALGLLVTFRTNASYDRYCTARALWGTAITTSRDLGRLALQWLPASPLPRELMAIGGPQRVGAQKDVLRLLNAFAITLKFHLTSDGGYYELDESFLPDRNKIHGYMKAELAEKAELSEAEVEALVAAPNKPLWVIQRLGGAIHAAAGTAATATPTPAGATAGEPAAVSGTLDPVLMRELDLHVQRLTSVLGGCERILRTPLPTSYTRHTSRFLFIWLHSMPLVLYPTTGVGTLPAALFIAWALLAIEDTGVRLEEPFDVLPLWQYCKVIEQSTQQLARSGGGP